MCPNPWLQPQTDDLRSQKDMKPSPQPKVETASEDDDDFVAVNREKHVKVSPPVKEPLTSAETSGEPQTVESPAICHVQDHFDIPALPPKFSPDELIGTAFLHEIEDCQ